MARLYTYKRGLFFDWRRRETVFNNKHFDNQVFLCREERYVFIRFEKKDERRLVGTETFYYDGFWMNAIHILGFTIGHGYNWDSRPMDKWDEEELKDKY